VNHRVDVALAARADGVHLPGDGFAVAEARALTGADFLLGRSIHDLAELGASATADYVVFGPVFDTPSKRPYGAPQGLERLAAVTHASAAPVLAIGGITPERVADVVTSGAVGVAVMGAILSAASPAMVVRSFREALASRLRDDLSFNRSGW